jgi:hypothetical protein
MLHYGVNLERLAQMLFPEPPTSKTEHGTVNQPGTYSFPTDEERIGTSQERKVQAHNNSETYTASTITENTSESMPEMSPESHPDRMRENRARRDLSPTDMGEGNR